MLQLSNIHKIYSDGTAALAGVDLDIERGMVGLLGPNGAGKTTLLSILSLAVEPTRGQRSYFGLRPHPRNRSAIRRMIGYLPQELEPIEGLSGFEYLQLCATWRFLPLRGQALRRRIGAILEAVELQAVAHRRADQYSGGMVRRLGLAQAILHGPKILVVDEPTAGLDPEERIRFRNLITDLADEIPVLLSTHIVEDIEATCPRLAILAKGRKIFDGSPNELMGQVEGQLFLETCDGEQPSQTPSFTTPIGRRVTSAGQSLPVIHSLDPIPGQVPITPTLEEACSAYLLTVGHAHLDSGTN